MSQCRSDYTYIFALQIIFTDCFNRIFSCSLEYLLQAWWQGQQLFGRAWALLGMPLAMPLFETDVSHDSHVSATLVSYSCFMFVHGQ